MNITKPVICASILASIIAGSAIAQSDETFVPVGDVFYKRALKTLKKPSLTQELSPEQVLLFEKAAELGSNKAMYRLGKFYDFGNENANASKWYEMAALNGNPDAQYLIANREIEKGNCETSINYLINSSAQAIYDARELLFKVVYKEICQNLSPQYLFMIDNEAAKYRILISLYRASKAHFEGEITPKNLALAWGRAKLLTFVKDTDFKGEGFSKLEAISLFERINDEIIKEGRTKEGWLALKNICESTNSCLGITILDLPQDIEIKIRFPTVPIVPLVIPPSPPPPPPPPPPSKPYKPPPNSEAKNPSKFELYLMGKEAYKTAIQFEENYRKSAKGKIEYNLLRAEYAKGVEFNNYDSMHSIARLYLEENNKKEWVNWLKTAADAGSAVAIAEYAEYLIGRKEHCPEIEKYLKTASVHNYSDRIQFLEAKLFNGDVCADFKIESKAVFHFLNAAHSGNIESMIELSRKYSKKDYKEYDIITALTWGRIAYSQVPKKGFFAPPSVKELKNFLVFEYKKLSETEKKILLSETNRICSLDKACDILSDAEIMKLQGFEIN